MTRNLTCLALVAALAACSAQRDAPSDSTAAAPVADQPTADIPPATMPSAASLPAPGDSDVTPG